MGRPQVYKKWEPRIIDLDILLWDDLVLDTSYLTIPHPELMDRPFLLHLMAMLNPMANIPVINKTFDAIACSKPNIKDCFLKSFALSPRFIGIVNITPDSFSDGGFYYDSDQATKQALKLMSDGASIVDLGAQSTRPGSSIQSPQVEYTRLKPVLDNLSCYMRDGDVEVSIDTFWPDVILNVLESYNVAWINDVKGNLDDGTLRTIASSKCGIIIMHSFSVLSHKDDVGGGITIDPIDTINRWVEKNINKLLALGFDKDSIIIDPGIGFGKSLYQNIEILRNIEALRNFGCKILVGHSRKSFISSFSTELVFNRDLETIAVSSILCNQVDFLRVHNVRNHMQFFVAQAVLRK